MNKLFLFGAALLALACNPAGEEVYMSSLDNTWAKNKTQTFEFEIKDAQTPKNIIFVVRNNNDYPYSNIRVISSLAKVGQKGMKPDTLNYILAQPNGEWIGSGFGETKETLFQYKLNHKFPDNGKYRVEVKQAMRRDVLPGIEDFGIKIEQAKP